MRNLFSLPVVVLFLNLACVLAVTPAVGCQSLAISSRTVSVPEEAFSGSREAFEKKRNYLSFQLPYEPIKSVFDQLERMTGDRLITRGEAHVTVLTPPELEAVEKFVSIEDVERIALEESIQASDLTPVCLGRGEAILDRRKRERTYFIVVRSKNLLVIRRRIEALHIERGGERGVFQATKFYPHITVGFTKSDLHESHGVVKDERSCIFEVSLTRR